MSVPKSIKKNTIVTDYKTYDVKNQTLFGEPQASKITDDETGREITLYRKNIYVRNPDGSIGDLIMAPGKRFSFGISTDAGKKKKEGSDDKKPKKVTGYSLPIAMWDRENPTEEEKLFTEKLEELAELCKDELLKEPAKIGKVPSKFNRSNMDAMLGCLYWKKDPETMEEDRSQSPVLYAKLISDKNKVIKTEFYDEEGETVDVTQLFDQYCYVTPGIKIESIFISAAHIRLQVKISECMITPLQTKIKPLMRPERQRPNIEAKLEEKKEEDDGEGSLDHQDNADEEKTSPEKVSPAKKTSASKTKKIITRKVVKKNPQ